MTHLEKHDLLSPFQHGFRHRHSTETQLVLTVQDLSSSIDKGKHLDMVFLDFSTVFDKVPHQSLLHVLSHYDIRGPLHTWIKNLVIHRTQDTANSCEWQNLTSVVCFLVYPRVCIRSPVILAVYKRTTKHCAISDLTYGR